MLTLWEMLALTSQLTGVPVAVCRACCCYKLVHDVQRSQACLPTAQFRPDHSILSISQQLQLSFQIR